MITGIDPLTPEAVRRTYAIGLFVGGQMTLAAAAAQAGVEPQSIEQALREIVGRSAIATVPDKEENEEPPFVSVVTPMYNEEQNIPVLIERLVTVLSQLGTYEIILVNDGSRDRSAEIVREARKANPAIKLIDLSRNFGHQAALSAGLEYAQGRVVIMMDSDLQDPPEVLPEFVAAWRAGCDVAYAVREKRKEGPFKRAAYFLFYRLLHRVGNIDIPLDAGDFCLMDRRVVDEMLLLPEKSRFLRGLRSWVGFRQVGVRYERAARLSGEPKYTFSKLVKLALDGLVAFTTIPLRLATQLGFWSAFLGACWLFYFLIGRYVGFKAPPGWTSLASLALIIGGIQLVVAGVMGEYIGRIYEEVKGRPVFVVRKAYGAKRRVPNLAPDRETE